MTSDQALAKFGLPSALHHRDELRALLAAETEQERRGRGTEELLRTLCLQLFSLGVAGDALLIWTAKQSSFDAGCGLDIQFMCGAGLEATKQHLRVCGDTAAPAALADLMASEQAGDFEDWSPSKTLADYRRYHELA